MKEFTTAITQHSGVFPPSLGFYDTAILKQTHDITFCISEVGRALGIND